MKFSPNENVLRVALIVFSVVFGILSISLIVLGVVYIDELWWPRRYVGLDFLELPTMLIVLGSLSLFMAVVGCLCAKSYNSKLLLVFGGILLVILCLELTIAIIAFINFDEHGGTQTKTHQTMFRQFNSTNDEDLLMFQDIEDHYQCCGVTGQEKDCIVSEESDDGDPANVTIITSKGCAKAVNNHIQTVAAEIGYLAVAFSILRVAEIAYVFLIQQSLKKYY